MTWRRPVIAALVAALLFAAYLVDRGASRRASFYEWRLVDFDESTATRLEIRNQHGEGVLEKRGPEQWVLLDGDVEHPASHADVRAVIDNLRGAKKGVSFPAERLAEYGLDDPAQTMRVVGELDGEPRDVTVLFGRDTPQLGQVYAMVEGGDEIFTIGDWVRNQASRNPRSLRDLRLLAIPGADVTAMTFESRRDRWVVSREGEGWRLDTAGQPADGALAERVLQVLEALRATALDEEASTEGLGLDPPLLRVTLATAGGPAVLEIGDPAEGGETFPARSTRFDGVATVRRGAIRELLAPPADWGTRRLLWIPREEYARIETGRGETVAMALVPGADGEWVFEDTPGLPVHPAKLAEFLETLDRLAAAGRVSLPGGGPPSEETLRAHGVRPESLWVRVTAKDGTVHGFRQGQIDFNEGEAGALFLYREHDQTLWKTDPREAQFYAKVRGDIQDRRIATGFAGDVRRAVFIADGLEVALESGAQGWQLVAPGRPAVVVREADVRLFLEAAEELEATAEDLQPSTEEPSARVQFLGEDGSILHFVNQMESSDFGQVVQTPQGQFTVPQDSYARFTGAYVQLLRSFQE